MRGAAAAIIQGQSQRSSLINANCRAPPAPAPCSLPTCRALPTKIFVLSGSPRAKDYILVLSPTPQPPASWLRTQYRLLHFLVLSSAGSNREDKYFIFLKAGGLYKECTPGAQHYIYPETEEREQASEYRGDTE